MNGLLLSITLPRLTTVLIDGASLAATYKTLSRKIAIICFIVVATVIPKLEPKLSLPSRITFHIITHWHRWQRLFWWHSNVGSRISDQILSHVFQPMTMTLTTNSTKPLMMPTPTRTTSVGAISFAVAYPSIGKSALLYITRNVNQVTSLLLHYGCARQLMRFGRSSSQSGPVGMARNMVKTTTNNARLP